MTTRTGKEKLVECFGMFCMGVCRLLGRLLRVLIRWFRPILLNGGPREAPPSSGRDASLMLRDLIFNTQALG